MNEQHIVDDLELHPTIDDDQVEAEREYLADQARRYAADPTPEDIAWWASQDEPEGDDAELDERGEFARHMDGYENGLSFA